jgi:uncharacterized protein YqjF (DUF2071 family)
MHQTWDKLLFLHWPVDATRLRPLIPPELTIDTFGGVAWIGVVPFTMRDIRPPLAPPLPWASRSHEINVRTYVHMGGVPGVWFLSLDAANPLLVWGARASFALSYFHAAMQLREVSDVIQFQSRRAQAGAPPADFQAAWKPGERIVATPPSSLEFFLTERYCLYAARGRRIYRAAIHHRPWPLCAASLSELASTMIQSHGIVGVDGDPLVHALAAPIQVEIWSPRRVTP